MFREALAAGNLFSVPSDFEWALGHGPRFGIVRVDHQTRDRLPKLSAHWFAGLCASRRVPALPED